MIDLMLFVFEKYRNRNVGNHVVAKELLEVQEQNGMVPPPYAGGHDFGVYEWEEEDEDDSPKGV